MSGVRPSGLCKMFLLVVVLCFLPVPGLGQIGAISFAQERLIVDEGSTQFTAVQIPLVREGGTSGAVVVTITLVDNDNDFLTSESIVTTFADGSSQTQATAVIVNDATPEGNETFILTISEVSSGLIGSLSTMRLIIRANDQPYGLFQYHMASLSQQVQEPLNLGNSNITLTVTRGPGIFGRVAVEFEVVPSDPAFGTEDITPTRGSLIFSAGATTATATLTVNPDNIPEADELFFVRLINPSGGALLAQENTSASITIEANDAPISWSEALTTVNEDVGLFQLTITRGRLPDGSIVGDLSLETTVRVTTSSGSASSSSDFNPINRLITFSPGSSSLPLSVTIVDDDSPEGDEMFTVTLSSPSSDAVLFPPSVATVLIRLNDNAGGLVFFASPGPVVIREDEQTIGRFTVRRTVGTFGNLTAEWQITSNQLQDGSLASSDFVPARGNVTIFHGASDAFLDIIAFDDTIPEVSEGFTVELVRVVSDLGDLSDSSPRLASLIVAESDDVYGLLEWANDESLSVAGSAPRELRLAVNRSGDSIGIVSVEYNIAYLPPQGGTTQLVFSGSLEFQGGQTLRDLSITIPDTAFLESNGNFMATIENATLVGGANFLTPPVTSPRVGARSSVLIPVPVEATSGLICFAPQSLQVQTAEPESGTSTVDLTVVRSGSFGTATITWAISPSAASPGANIADIGANAGVVVIANGANSATFPFTVRADETPEINEAFVVTLILVTESNQMILTQKSEAVVTIVANDNPSGIFSISNSTSGPFVLTEDTNRILMLTVVRSRGDLTQELIQYDLTGEPGEIAGGQGIVEFLPGERSKDITLFVTNDNIPEVNETFVFSIQPLSPNVEVGTPTSVDITVLANDDFAGVFSFASSSLSVSIVEPGNNDTVGPDSIAVLTVMREAGAFGTVEVNWEVSNPSTDLSPISGSLVFSEGQRNDSFEISALPDNDPEAAENFNVVLTIASGEGRLASSSVSSTIIILQNDDPIRFDRSFAQVQEGETVTFTLIRGGQANGVADVTYSVSYQTASADDVELSPSQGVVMFSPGQTQANIAVDVLDDELPEEQELLSLSLQSVVGDAVLVSPTQATLVIEFSDDPNGLFGFADDSQLVAAEEGDTVQLMVVREGGSFGLVSLRWTVYSVQDDSSTRVVASSTDFDHVTGIVTFAPGDRMQPIALAIQDDGLPELAETVEVELAIITVEGTTVGGARLDNASSAIVVVEESDDPYGVLRIADNSTMTDIAEDLPPGDLVLGQTQLSVERTFGTIGAVQALWDVFTAPDNIFPDYVDLIFFGERGTGVTMATPRPNTATSALRFSGQPGSIVTVPMQYHPVNISSGFTISVWLQPSPNANGMIIAKTSQTGLIYALSLVADGNNFLVRLTYQQSANDQLLGLSTAEVSVPQSALSNAMWHSMIVTAGEGIARFYIDNNFIDSRTLLSSDLGDADGELTVGGQIDSNFYTGNLMDVRIYVGILQSRQIEVLSGDGAALSLTPISGYISYPAGTDLATITISSVDDDIPEPSQMLVLSLTNVAGGARLSGSQDAATITVLKSDSSNGVFGFVPLSDGMVIDEPGMASLAVNRSGGSFNDVTVTWEIREAETGEVAAQDFNPATGHISFGDGEDLQTFVVMTLDESAPELREDFVVVLTSAIAQDNETSSTPLSGASIDASRSQVMLTVTENDSPYGVLQFSTSAPIPGQPITLATEMPELAVQESDGTVTIYVVRAQGSIGTVSIEFITTDDSATHLGLEPDYRTTAGRLTFDSGVRVQSFNVTILDDSNPELGKTFFVNLTNPQGDISPPDLGIGQSMAIAIQPSDDAFGRFSFSPNSLSHIAPEQAGGIPLSFTVIREGGTFGEVEVYWAASQGNMEGQVMDVSPATGVAVFAEGERQQEFTVFVTDDLIPELLEVITVRLVNVTVGASITSVSSATITIQANDHPYGRFVFSPALRPLVGVTEAGRVEVVVTREFGALGQVMVDVQTVSSQDISTNQLITGLVDVQQLIDNSQLATTNEDYDAISTTLTFENGQTSSSFYINVTDDLIPEIDEYLFALISRVELNQSSLTSVDSSVLPSVAPGNDSLAILIIAENDDARGVIQFSEATITTSEPFQDFLTLSRTEGLFGNLTVQWETVSGSAAGADFSPQRGSVIITAGVREATLPIVILEDSIPEFAEQFMVRLVSVAGGGRLGAISTSTVNIEASDDPNGAFEFAIGSRTLIVEEPQDGEMPTTVTMTVQRLGGTLGVVTVSWRIISSNGNASDDILPVSGLLQFITSSTEQSFILSILPDNIPELDEVYSVELVSATGGGNIGVFSIANITVPSNDGPHGVVAFSAPSAVTTEEGDNGTSIATVTIERSIGFFGDIRVLYNVQSTDAATLALADGTPLLSYFDPPMSNATLEASALLQELTGFVSLDGCGRGCLSARTCLAFSIAVSSGVCQLYLATQTPDNLVSMEGFDYYQKQQDRVLQFYQAIATEGNDFSAAVGQSVIISDGEMSASIPITIFGDDMPELDESLTVTLTSLELVGSSGEGDIDGGPILGAITESTLTILENDDPRGVFVIAGSDGSSIVRVIEPDSFTFGITLQVEREQGSIGQVSVGWSVAGGTALPGQDFIGNGATLVFEDGETEATIALVILADDVPEIDETLVVALNAPSGGARIGQQGTATVIIDANDGVAGVVGLSELSRSAVVGEGETTMFELVRRDSAMGQVQVDWRITGTSNASLEFQEVQGTDVFQEGENTTNIMVTVRADATPELAERYTLTLIGVRTISNVISSGSGAATLDSQASQATITIRASNNPHGEVAFQDNSLMVNAQEGESPQFTIVRQFGTFGAIDVTYMAVNGSVSAIDGDTSLASAGMDFNSEEQTVRLEDGQQSAIISVPIIDDTAPELDEVFTVRLTSVTLVGGSEGTVPPSLGSASVAEVTIGSNDSPRGTITFLQDSYMVQEDVGSVDIVISRQQGTVGQVSVVYFVMNQQATNGEDFLVETLDNLVFSDGQDSSTLSIPIVDDTEPEIEERFCVGLRLPRDGAILGNITFACVTILPNDDAYGVFRFDQNSLTTVLQETVGTATTNNVAELRVVRDAGTFGQVTVPFEVVPIEPEGATTMDVSPNRGALLFNPDEQLRVIQIEAVADSTPELAELFRVVLLDPATLGRLSDNFTEATIGILPNQDPQGVLDVAPIDNPLVGGVLIVEEDAMFINFQVTRSFGSFNEVSATIHAAAGTATTSEGQTVSAGASQVFNTTSASVAYSFAGNDNLFLVIGSSTDAVLYGWRGVFTPIATLTANGVTGFTAFSVAGGDIVLVMTNGGTSGNRETFSIVYRVTATEEIIMIQNLLTVGANEVVSFQPPSSEEWYVAVANGEDNAGNPNVDSYVYRWNGTALVLVQRLPTIGASALTSYTVNGALYLAVASLTDTRSQVFIWSGGQFRLDYVFDTQQATDVAFLPQGPYLLVTSESAGLHVLNQNEGGQFRVNVTLPLQGPVKVERVPDEDSSGIFVVTNTRGPAQMFVITDTITPFEVTTVSLPIAEHVFPFSIPSGSTSLAAVGTSRESQEISTLYEISTIDTNSNDFYSKNLTLIFRPGESLLHFTVAIFNDDIPEVDESFVVSLSMPGGGARIGQSSTIPTTILTNDDAHGLIGFSDDSLSVVLSEMQSNFVLTLQVERNMGTFGLVIVEWELSGSHAEGEITPASGQVTFADGVSVAAITLLVRADDVAELNEVTMVTLTRIVENGVAMDGEQNRGATLVPARNQAAITVAANDDPHGVVMWSSTSIIADELEGGNNVIEVAFIREFGAIGAVIISYATEMAGGTNDAQSLVDFIPTTGDAIMSDGQTSATISITILPDNMPEPNESFIVNITGVRIANEADREGSITDSPRVNQSAQILEVVIRENDNNRGLLSFNVQSVEVVEMFNSLVTLSVVRTRGTFGSVSVEYAIVPGSATTADYNALTANPLVFESSQEIVNITIDIINDQVPELDETFEVILRNSAGGAEVGLPSSVTVTILSNDDINGVFSFADSSLLIVLSETMGTASLVVERDTGSTGEVTVFWEVAPEGRSDLEPVDGNLTFPEGVQEQNFSVQAIQDGIPESFEAYPIRLVSIIGGGRIVDPQESVIAIQASDDPTGVLGLQQFPDGLMVIEGGVLVVGITRQAGTSGTVTLMWDITPPDATVFATIRDTVVLVDGQADATITVQTLSDTIPEVTRRFTLQVVSVTLARVDVNATSVEIIVPASNNPHGTVEFLSSDSITAMEGDSPLQLSIVRREGLIGDLRVNYTALFTSADEMDINFGQQSILIPSEASGGVITVEIIDDTLHELDETFTILLTSVELQDASDDLTIPPSLGGVTEVSVTIQASDDPFGSISIGQSMYSVEEGSTLAVDLVRDGGTLGVVTVTYATVSGTARSPDDYTDTSGSIVFAQGQTTAQVLIPTVDDQLPEPIEDFGFGLTGGPLGNVTSATVFIAASDSPFGVVGFNAAIVSSGISIPNPTVSPSPVTLMVTRAGGAIGNTDIVWTVTGPRAGEVPTADIATESITGTLTLTDGQRSGSIVIMVLPTTTDEQEEVFTVNLSSATNNVLIDSSLQQVQITVQQNGSPFGVVSFLGDALRTQRVSEGTDLILPLERGGDLLAPVDVTFIVSQVDSTDPAQPDVNPATGTVTFPILQGRTSLVLGIIMDDVAELDEMFRVTLTGATSGANINPLANSANFIINANGSPLGEYGITNANIVVDSTGETVSRSLMYTIVRRGGNMTTANIIIQHSYSQDTSAEVVPPVISRSLPASVAEFVITIPVVPGSYLYPGSVFTITISNVTVTSPAAVAGMDASISSADSVAQAVVLDAVANIAVGFSTQSLVANVDEASTVNNVVLTVFQQGQLGNAEVSWTTGTSTGVGFVPGSLLPMTGTLNFPAQQNTTTLTLTASAAMPHGIAELFVVSLAVISLDQSFPSQVDTTSMTATIDPMGVLLIPSTSYSGVEGEMVFIPVWRRFGSMGSITVTGAASAVSASTLPSQVIAAVPSTDFSPISISITLEEGVTTGFFNITLSDNSISSALKVFQFSLTSATPSSPLSAMATSPRLSSVNTTTSITIVDDEGGAGQFRLSTTTATLTEGSSFTFSIERIGGTSGTVSVLVQTQETGLATSGVDYQAFSEDLLFTSGVSQLLMSVNILDDPIPEGPEGFDITLSVPGGNALIDPNANTLSVVIEASDNPAGVFSFLTASLLLSEGGPSSGELEVRRTGNLEGVVMINWEALYTDGEEHPVPVTALLVNARGTITFGDNSATSDVNIMLELVPNMVPSIGEQFSVRLSSVTPGVGFGTPAEALVTVQPRVVGTFHFPRDNLTVVASTSQQQVSLLIERSEGLQTTAVITYNTTQPRQPVVVGSRTFQPAQPVHFTQIQTTVTFNPGEVSHLIDIPIISAPDTPVAFFVHISSTGHTIPNNTATILLSPPGPATSLLSVYTDALDIVTSQDLERVATEMFVLLTNEMVSGQDNEQTEITQLILEEMIQKTLVPVNIDYSNTNYIPRMLEIFRSLIVDASFSGRSQFLESMQNFAYSLVESSLCDGPPVIHSTPQYYLYAAKISPPLLAGMRFSSSSDSDYIQYPSQAQIQVDCFNVSYIEFFTNNLFIQPTFQSKVLSLSVQNTPVNPSTSDPVMYRIFTDQNFGVIPDGDDCLLWRSPSISGAEVPSDQWDSSVCTPQTHIVLQENFIQCACSELGSVAISDDLVIGYGWTFPAGISTAIVIIAVLLVMIIHFRYFSRTQLATRILMCLTFSVFLFQLILLVDIFASDSAGLSANGCAAIGALLQFTAVAQFLWIAAMAIALWSHFIGCTSGNEPLAIYIIVTWGLAILIVVVTLLIGRFAANLELNTSDGVYGPIRDLCFVPNLSVSLLSIVLPVVLSLLAMVALLSYTCFYWSRWEDIKSLYHDSFNRTEIPLLLGFFGIIFLSSLAAYLHAYIGLTYTFGAFVILNTLEGVYALVVYFFVSWHTLTRKHNKYNVGDEVEALDVPGEDENEYFGSLSFSSLGSSKEQLVQSSLKEEPLEHSSPESGVVSLGMRPLNSGSTNKSPYVPLGEESKDDSHMDDLLFMLKTQNFSPGSVGSDESEPSTARPKHNRSGGGTEHFERRRISIADTHL